MSCNVQWRRLELCMEQVEIFESLGYGGIHTVRQGPWLDLVGELSFMASGDYVKVIDANDWHGHRC